MNAADDWSRWSGDWQQQEAPDVDRLRRRVRRKLWKMRAALVLELLCAVFATAQLARLLTWPGVGPRWQIWAIIVFVLVAVLVWLQLRLRRGAWRTAGERVPELLRLSARQARASLRLAWLNITGFVALLALTLATAWPWLLPSRWAHDPTLRALLGLQIGINGSLAIAALVFLVWFMRRQKQHLQRAEALLRSYSD